MIKPFDVTVLSGAGKHFSGESDLVVSDFQREIADILWKVSYAGNIVRKDGITALENYYCYLLEEENCQATDRFFNEGLCLIIDGTDEEYVEDILSARILVDGADTASGYKKYLIMRGLWCIQVGVNPRVRDVQLFSFIPERHRETIRKLVEELNQKREVRLPESRCPDITSVWD